MSVGLFDFHYHSTDNISNTTEGRFVNLCFNRYKTCQIDPGLHRYILDTEIEDGKKNILK